MKIIISEQQLKRIIKEFQKDSDYYESRDDLFPTVDNFIFILKGIDNKMKKSGGVYIDDLEKNFEIMKEAIYEMLDDVNYFDDEVVGIVKEYIKNKMFLYEPEPSRSNKDYSFIKLNPNENESRHSIRIIVLNRFNNKGQKIYIGFKQIPERMELVKFIDAFNENYNKNISPEGILKKEAEKLLRDGKSVEEVIKLTNLDKDTIEEIKYEIDSVVDPIQTTSTEDQGFVDDLARKIHVWDGMIEKFRERGKFELQREGVSKDDIINFDIMVDRFRDIIKKNEYNFKMYGGNYHNAICKMIINASYNDKQGLLSVLFNVRNIESVYYFLKACHKMSGSPLKMPKLSKSTFERAKEFTSLGINDVIKELIKIETQG